jgi:hypothetical protein
MLTNFQRNGRWRALNNAADALVERPDSPWARNRYDDALKRFWEAWDEINADTLEEREGLADQLRRERANITYPKKEPG